MTVGTGVMAAGIAIGLSALVCRCITYRLRLRLRRLRVGAAYRQGREAGLIEAGRRAAGLPGPQGGVIPASNVRVLFDHRPVRPERVS